MIITLFKASLCGNKVSSIIVLFKPNLVFSSISVSICGYRTNFYLHQHPDLSRGPLRVFIDDVEIPAVDAAFGSVLWRYAGEQNAVLFQPLYVPAPGKTVRFHYTPDCQR